MAGDVLRYLIEKKYDNNKLSICLIHHQIETLDYNNKFILLNYLFNKEDLSDYEKIMKEYFDSHIINTEHNSFIFLLNKHNNFLIKEGKQWSIAKPASLIELFDTFSKNINTMTEHLNNIIGYYSENKTDEMVFKVQDRKHLKNKGARSDQLSKVQLLNYLNQFTDQKYTKENTKGLISNKLAIHLEMLIRYKELTKTDNVRYFITPEEEKSLNIKT
tara:strand:- start:54 stop:704 length:651 start_codon:yes stop_codon:yes gene_type:complete